jgi:hypothetical protein
MMIFLIVSVLYVVQLPLLYSIHSNSKYNISSASATSASYYIDTYGRNQMYFPSPKCCEGFRCIGSSPHVNAIVCILKGTSQINYAINLYCSLQNIYSTIPFILLSTDHPSAIHGVLNKIKSLGIDLRFVSELLNNSTHTKLPVHVTR